MTTSPKCRLAAGDPDLWRRAVAMYDVLLPRLSAPDDTPLLGYPLKAEFAVHAKPMCRMTVAAIFHAIRPEQRKETIRCERN